jgi:hypothetical protein
MNSWISGNGEVTRMPVMSTRRSGHGGSAWSLPFTEQVMTQPQDGAVDTGTRLASIRSHQHSDVLHESEDARLTGGTRSLDRRLLGLNVMEAYRKACGTACGNIVRMEVA